MARNKPSHTFGERMRAAQVDFATSVALDPQSHPDHAAAARDWLLRDDSTFDLANLTPEERATLNELLRIATGGDRDPNIVLMTVRATGPEYAPCEVCGRSEMDIQPGDLDAVGEPVLVTDLDDDAES